MPGLTGILFMTYILKMLTKIDMLASAFVVDMKVVLISTIVMYMFNIIVGLLPVINVLRHTPANILARHDID